MFCFLVHVAEMVNIQQKRLATEEVMKQAWQQLTIATEGMAEVQVLMAEFTRETQERDRLMKRLLNSLETELASARVVEHAKEQRSKLKQLLKK